MTVRNRRVEGADTWRSGPPVRTPAVRRSSVAKSTYLEISTVGRYGHLCMACRSRRHGRGGGEFGLSNLYSLSVFPRRFGHQRLTCRSRTHFRFGWGANAEHRRFMTEPLLSRH